MVWSINASGNWFIYIDGTLESGYRSANMPRKIPNTTYDYSYIFKSVQSTQTKGNIDNFRIYNRVLPQADVTSLYTYYSTFPPQTYTINFPEETEIQLLLLDNSKYIEIDPYLFSGSADINVGLPSEFDTTTTTSSTLYNSGFDSTITGTSVTYNSPVVVVRYKYTRTLIQIQTINDDYKYISFPNKGENQTPYTISFPEETEVQLLLLDNSKYIKTAPYLFSGSADITVGTPSEFDTTTTTSSTPYNSGFDSSITGLNVTYTDSIVILRYKYTRPLIQIQTINDDYKYISFPNMGTENQTSYIMNFPERTEVQLLLLSDTNVTDITSFTITTGNADINVGKGAASTFSDYDTSEIPTSYTDYDSSITGTNVTYTDAVVIVRYKYTRPLIQIQTINDDYKYISFPNKGTENQTPYTMNFPEETEVQLLLLSDTNVKDITPLTISTGNVNINVGKGEASTFSAYDTSSSPTSYTDYDSSITGTSITYNSPVVIVRYKYTREPEPVVTINDDYKYISFPKTAKQQTSYALNFFEDTEVQLIVLNNNYARDVSTFVVPIGTVQIVVGIVQHSSFGTLSSSSETVIAGTHYSDITGETVGYTDGIVIVRYKYTREVLQIQTISDEYKYISFPSAGANSTQYSMDFKEETKVQLLLLSSQEVTAVDPSVVFGGTVYINVGNGGSPSTFGITSTSDDSTFYSSFDSSITGESITYTNHVVIVRYKLTKIVVVQVPSYGFLNFNEDNSWNIAQPSLNDLGETITTDKITDLNVPTDLSELGNTLTKDKISDLELPTDLSDLGGTITIDKISDFPTEFDSLYFRKDQINQVLTSATGNNFQLPMNAFGIFEDGFNARFNITLTVKSSQYLKEKYCMANVYFKHNNGTDPVTNTLVANFIGVDAEDWDIVYGGSNEGVFYLEVLLDHNTSITQLYAHIS